MGGELVARGIVEGDQTWRLFAPYELVWAGGTWGRVIAQGLYWGRKPGERIAQALARNRERRRLAKAARLAALAAGLPVIPRPMIPPAELAAVAIPEVAAAVAPPSGEPPAGGSERRRNRGKKGKNRNRHGKNATEPAASS